MSGTVAWISIAPVKALGLVQLREVFVDEFGIRENRRFYLVDAGGRFVNGKRLGSLVRVAPEWDEASETLALRLPDGSVVSGRIELGGPLLTNFYGRPVPGRFVDGPWDEALSALAGEPLRLVLTDIPGDAVDRGRGGAVTLLGAASLEALARAAGLDGSVDGRRFRMTFGVAGLPPYAEDEWLGRDVAVGEAVFRPSGNVGRCAVTTQNPETGVPDFDTLRVLKRYRDDVPTTEPLPFGIHADVVGPGRVRLGDSVDLHD